MNTTTKLDAIGAAGCKIGMETMHPAPQPTDLGRDIAKAVEKYARLSEFEAKHHEFIQKCGSDCFLNGDSVTFLTDRRADVRQYFGADGWRLVSGPAATKVVDGIIVRLVLDPAEFGPTEIVL